jgi:hypothetical protein
MTNDQACWGGKIRTWQLVTRKGNSGASLLPLLLLILLLLQLLLLLNFIIISFSSSPFLLRFFILTS